MAQGARRADAVRAPGPGGGPPRAERAARQFAPVANIIGWLSLILGVSMGAPAFLDWLDGSPNWQGMLLAGFLTASGGGALAQVTAGHGGGGLSRHQAFLLTVLIWVVLPLFGALPFVFGAPLASYTDAFSNRCPA